MFKKFIDNIKSSAGGTLRLTSIAAVAAITLVVTFAFLCAAGFVYVHRTYGLIEACFAGAGLFFFISILLIGYYLGQKSEMERVAANARAEAEARAKQQASERSLLQTALSDPLVVATGLQVVRAIGIKRLIPILAAGGIAAGFWASRRDDPGAPAEPEDT